MVITNEMVKELRLLTGAGMMICKEALKIADGDMKVAIEYIKHKSYGTEFIQEKVIK